MFWMVLVGPWLLVVGIFIGGAAVPHVEDKPRILSALECESGR